MSTTDADTSGKADLANTATRLDAVSKQLGEKRVDHRASSRGRASRSPEEYDCATQVAIATQFATAAEIALETGDLGTCEALLSWGQAWASTAEDCLAAG